MPKKEMKKKILIVDDQRDIQLLLKRRLEAEGYAVIQALNGEEGLHKADQDEPDLILLDVVMPRLGGIDFIERIRPSPKGVTVPVIVISNRSSMVNSFPEGTIDGFFNKPLDNPSLLEKIKECLAKKESLEALKALKDDDEEDQEQEQNPLKVTPIKPRPKGPGRAVLVCSKCNYVATNQKDPERCSYCGHPEFYTTVIYD